MNRFIVGVVGHTNTGKTSLIRTLIRDKSFGEIIDQPGTTRHVEAVTLPIDESKALELRDTPGLEDSSALKQYINTFTQSHARPREALEQCIAGATNKTEFAQEIKVLKQALQCQVLMYVIDCREPVFEKYLDELAILRMSATPILPVLNFIQDGNQFAQQWQSVLADQGLHASVHFDTVAYDFESEKRLYQKLQTLAEPHYELLQKLIDKRQTDWLELKKTACKRVAHLIFDACAIELDQANQALETLQNKVRELEQRTLNDILLLMRFTEEDVVMSDLPVRDGHWKFDLASTETLKILGVDTASAAATGAAIGAGVDLIFAGLSLGAAAATGAALGTVWSSGKRFGKPLIKKVFGNPGVRIDETTLDLLILRQLWLLRTLFHRGHAAQVVAQEGKESNPLPLNWPPIRQQVVNSANGIGRQESDVLETLQNFLFETIA